MITISIAIAAQNLTKIRFTPQWTAQSQWAGYYVAYEKGFYKNAGLDVEISHPWAANPSINKLKKGESDIITLTFLEALKYRNNDIDLVNILQTSQNDALMFVSEKPINNVRNMEGMKIGCWKAGYSDLAKIYLKEQGVNVQWIPFIQNINLFVSGAIDATLCYRYNEYFQILATGAKLTKENIINMSDVGYNIPEDGVYVLDNYYNTHREIINKFIRASIQGWQWADKHPEETLDIVMKYVKNNHIATNIYHQKHMLREILTLQKDKNTGIQSFAPISKEKFQFAEDLLQKNNIISKKINYENFIK